MPGITGDVSMAQVVHLVLPALAVVTADHGAAAAHRPRVAVIVRHDQNPAGETSRHSVTLAVDVGQLPVVDPALSRVRRLGQEDSLAELWPVRWSWLVADHRDQTAGGQLGEVDLAAVVAEEEALAAGKNREEAIYAAYERSTRATSPKSLPGGRKKLVD